MKETSHLMGMENGLLKKSYPEPLSLQWRINHTIGYLLGGTTFLAGSIYYYPSFANYVLGGWLFTIGSAGFLFADLNEWWKNNRAGCAFDGEYADEFEASVGKDFGPKDTTWGSYLRKENGLNFAFSAFGSFLYLLGSIFFIPDTNMLTDGTIVFIWGSSVIFLSQAWKVYRQGLEVKYNPQVDDFCRREFKFSNYSADLPALGVDAFAGLGGLAYLIGSVYFLPSIDVSDEVTIIAANWFVTGGFFFTLSGLFIVYRYYCTLNYTH